MERAESRIGYRGWGCYYYFSSPGSCSGGTEAEGLSSRWNGGRSILGRQSPSPPAYSVIHTTAASFSSPLSLVRRSDSDATAKGPVAGWNLEEQGDLLTQGGAAIPSFP
jgi:hypothetical protein